MVSHFFEPLQKVCLKMARLLVKWLCVDRAEMGRESYHSYPSRIVNLYSGDLGLRPLKTVLCILHKDF